MYFHRLVDKKKLEPSFTFTIYPLNGVACAEKVARRENRETDNIFEFI